MSKRLLGELQVLRNQQLFLDRRLYLSIHDGRFNISTPS